MANYKDKLFVNMTTGTVSVYKQDAMSPIGELPSDAKQGSKVSFGDWLNCVVNDIVILQDKEQNG